MNAKHIKTILSLLIFSLLFNGCATTGRENKVLKEGFETYSTIDEQKSFESITENNEVENSGKEFAWAMIMVATFPLWFPIMLLAAACSGVS